LQENFALQTKLATAYFPPLLNFTIPECIKMSLESFKSCGLLGLPPHAGQNFHIQHQKGIMGHVCVYIISDIDNIFNLPFLIKVIFYLQSLISQEDLIIES